MQQFDETFFSLKKLLLPIGIHSISFGNIFSGMFPNADNKIVFLCDFIEGSGKLLFRGKNILFAPNKIIALNCNDAHEWDVRQAARVNILALDTRILEQNYSISIGLTAAAAMRHVAYGSYCLTDDYERYAIVHGQVSCFFDESKASASKNISYLVALWSLAMHCCEQCEEMRINLTYNERNPETNKVEKAVEYIQHNYNQKITLSDLAKISNMSVSNFSAYFKRTMGKSPLQFLSEQRIHCSMNMLRSTNIRILDIAEDCGFFSVSNYIKAFKSILGITPSQYRKDNMNRK